MSNENINSLANEPGVNIILPDGYTHYVDPQRDVEPTASEAVRTQKALGNLTTVYAGTVAQAGRRVPSDSPYATMEIVATDPDGNPILMRPASGDEHGNITYEVSSDPVYDQRGKEVGQKPRRPVLQRPGTVSFHTDQTNESLRAGKHMDHSAAVRDGHFLRARRKWLVTRSYTDPRALGVDDETLAQFDSSGRRVAPDPTNQELRTFNQLNHDELLKLYLATKPDSFNASVARNGLGIYEDSMEKGVASHHIVLNHGHHYQWHKPWTWKHRGHGHGHDHDDDHNPYEEAEHQAHEATQEFLNTATLEEQETFRKLLARNDPDRVDRFVNRAGNKLNMSQKMKLAINTIGQLMRYQGLEGLEELRVNALVDFNNTSRHKAIDRRLFKEAQDFFKGEHPETLTDLAADPNISNDLRTYIRSLVNIIYAQRSIRQGAKTVAERIKINNHAKALEEAFERKDAEFLSTTPTRDEFQFYYSWLSKKPEEIEAYMATAKNTKQINRQMVEALELMAKVKRAKKL